MKIRTASLAACAVLAILAGGTLLSAEGLHSTQARPHSRMKASTSTKGHAVMVRVTVLNCRREDLTRISQSIPAGPAHDAQLLDSLRNAGAKTIGVMRIKTLIEENASLSSSDGAVQTDIGAVPKSGANGGTSLQFAVAVKEGGNPATEEETLRGTTKELQPGETMLLGSVPDPEATGTLRVFFTDISPQT